MKQLITMGLAMLVLTLAIISYAVHASSSANHPFVDKFGECVLHSQEDNVFYYDCDSGHELKKTVWAELQSDWYIGDAVEQYDGNHFVYWLYNDYQTLAQQLEYKRSSYTHPVPFDDCKSRYFDETDEWDRTDEGYCFWHRSN